LKDKNTSFLDRLVCVRVSVCIVLASDGASDYGNKFGEPVVQGFMRSFGMVSVRVWFV
jgi:hypothetical protein